MGRFISVVVPVPFLPALLYRVSKDLALPKPGSRVRVPLGSRVVTGCVINTGEKIKVTKNHSNVKDIVECLDDSPFLPREVLEIALWVSEYYACGPGDAIFAAMPPFALASGSRASSSGSAFKTIRVAHLVSKAHEIFKTKREGFFGVKQRLAVETLTDMPEGISVQELSKCGVSSDTLQRLIRRGIVIIERQRVERDPFVDGHINFEGKDSSVDLTDEQRSALSRLSILATSEDFRVALLHGVTGSGKTEVYIRLARSVQARGRRILVLVPEIALTSAVASAFYREFKGRVAVQHSGLSNGERHDQWHRIRRGDVDVVVGTRSGVFAPLDNLGLVVVDEEQDASYKQDETPRYHGRDVAIMRAKRSSALVVLGSATPSMESYYNASNGRYSLVSINKRVMKRPLATVSIVDMRKEMASEGSEVVISRQLRESLSLRLDRQEQALILLNRRGYATAVLCRQCGRTLECPNCSVTLTVHRTVKKVRCHYCSYSLTQPKNCVHCSGQFLEQVGFGTERIEAEIRKAFPEAVVARFDRDIVRRRGAAELILSQFKKREIDILVGTQMIAKGHDFPTVTLVGVISADVGLRLADFRAAERTFQLLTQVSGRAGRGILRGEAIIQTFYPDHYSVELACQQAYEPFFDAEIHFRRSMSYPPVVAMVNTIVRGKTLGVAMREASELASLLRASPGEFLVLGPAPAPLTRLRGESRVQIFLKGTKRREMREALLGALQARPSLRRHVTVDVDPLSLL